MAKEKEPIEKQLWKSADKLRKNIDAAEYKHIVLGLIFLKYISDAFNELYEKLKAGDGEYSGADPEDKDEYKAENVFFIPEISRWQYLVSKAKMPDIGKIVDDAMDAIEKENSSLKDVLPKVFARGNLDPTNLGGLIDLIGNISFGDAKARSTDLLGHVFEYFLGEFALAEGKKGGQFYTPKSVVELLVEMLEPYKGRVFDPCCGSGGMFVQSEKFVESHQGKINDISIYGQESNHTTWRLAKMNLAIRGIDSSQVRWNNEGSFLNDSHKDLKADYVIANPPFNDSDWSGDLLRQDGRWKFGTPPSGNANYAWIQHFLYHLSPTGIAGFVLAKGSLTSKTSGEGDIRKALIEARLVDCIVNLPAKLFLNTQIPACLWFLRRAPQSPKGDERKEILFIDARNEGYLINRRTKELSNNDIQKIATTYHNWRNTPRPPEGGKKKPSVLHSADPALYRQLEQKAKEMRANPTQAEGLLWNKLKNKQLGVKFRQQHVINKFIVDFCSIEKALIIEIDGEIHNNQKEKDEERTRILQEEGYIVIRYTNNEILSDLDSVISSIQKQLSKSPLGDLGAYKDIKGFCNSASIDRVRELDYVLTPGRYVGLPDEEDDFDFNERFTSLKNEFEEQLKEEEKLNKAILENLAKVQLK
ncbi:MAG: N-6 DNA methylase [Spirochaetes bacterium]|nr:N-6 DNA methylase [Spirochaetota bacterium]